MNLTARTVHAPPDWCAVGATVRVDPPTCQKHINGVVVELDGFVATVRLPNGIDVAVDIEDCLPA